jgi:hypothetical protein
MIRTTRSYSLRRPGMGTSDREYVAIESFGHKTAQPIITICLERGGRGILSYGVNSNLCRLLSDADREQIAETVRKILEARK